MFSRRVGVATGTHSSAAKIGLHLPGPKQLSVHELSRFRERLLHWYRAHHRNLPWRKTHDPYRIWVSEIMLQQTRVAAMIERYSRFLDRFPDVLSLAQANVEDVLTVWSGLGYYRRARALHEAARQIVASGRMPRTQEEWRKLPGIGRYTAAAIASIAHGECCAVVDGNVERVVRRLISDPQAAMESIWQTTQAWLSRRSPGEANQAMMELGATICLPAAPRCPECPLRPWCRTRGVLPGSTVQSRRLCETAYVLCTNTNQVYLCQREETERLMPLMWELPEVVPNGTKPIFTVRHSITITDFNVSVFRGSGGQRGGCWISKDQVETLPLTGLARKILRRTGII